MLRASFVLFFHFISFPLILTRLSASICFPLFHAAIAKNAICFVTYRCCFDLWTKLLKVTSFKLNSEHWKKTCFEIGIFESDKCFIFCLTFFNYCQNTLGKSEIQHYGPYLQNCMLSLYKYLTVCFQRFLGQGAFSTWCMKTIFVYVNTPLDCISTIA